MEFRIRENKFGCYIDLYTDNGILIIGGGNKYESVEHAEAAINTVKSPVTYITNPQVTENSSGSDWDSGLSMGGIKEDSYGDDDWGSTFKFFRD